MTAPIKQASFSGGEISPLLYGRTDQIKYETGLRAMRNYIAMRHGGATNRPGTMYVGTTQNGGNAVRLIPFIFNETGNGQSYVLEFGNLYIGFYQNGGVVTSGGNPYTIVSPYAQADISSLKFAESADVITIVHPNYPPYELKRVTATNWTLSQVSLTQPGTMLQNLVIAGTAGASDGRAYLVTGVNANGEESYLSQGLQVIATGIKPATVTTQIQLTWGQLAINPGSYYRVYMGYVDSNNAICAWGYIGTSQTQTFVDTGVIPDYTNAPPISQSPISGAGSYPSTVGFVQQRRVFGASSNSPLLFYMTHPGSFSNIAFHTIPQSADAIFSTLAGQEVNMIQHIIELKFMLILTSGAEIYVQGNGTGVVTPSGINASIQSQYGASPLRPLRIADTLIFNQALGSFIRDLRFDFVINGYNGNDLTVFASHLFEENSLVDWDYQKIPDSIVWAVRNDGVLLGLTYMREQQVLAWHRHDFTNGFVENVCCVPENGQYAVYLCIRRVINGATVRYIERMSSRIWSDVLNATYLDCFSSFNGTNQGSTTMALSAPGGNFIQDGTAYQQKLTLVSNTSFFTPAMVGDQIFLSDTIFNLNKGNMVDPENDGSSFALSENGNQIRCTIASYVSATQITIFPNKAVPPTLQNIAITTWARAVNKLSGLGYLAGQQVSVWADRFVVASPNNSRISFQAQVGLDGSLALDKWYAVIYVGLPITSDLETLDLETSFGETVIGKRKRQNKLYAHFYRTRTVFSGSENPDSNRDNVNGDLLFQLAELKTGTYRETYDQSPQLSTEQEYITEVSRWNKNGRIFLRSVDPVPVTVLAVVPAGDSPAQSPFYERV